MRRKKRTPESGTIRASGGKYSADAHAEGKPGLAEVEAHHARDVLITLRRERLVSTSVANSPDVIRKRQGKTVDAPDGTNPIPPRAGGREKAPPGGDAPRGAERRRGSGTKVVNPPTGRSAAAKGRRTDGES